MASHSTITVLQWRDYGDLKREETRETGKGYRREKGQQKETNKKHQAVCHLEKLKILKFKWSFIRALSPPLKNCEIVRAD